MRRYHAGGPVTKPPGPGLCCVHVRMPGCNREVWTVQKSCQVKIEFLFGGVDVQEIVVCWFGFGCSPWLSVLAWVYSLGNPRRKSRYSFIFYLII